MLRHIRRAFMLHPSSQPTPAAAVRPIVSGFYHEPTCSIAYIAEDPSTKHAAIIDPVLDFEEKAARVSTEFADALVQAVRARGLKVEWILDTHPHADHFSAAP